MKGREAPSDRTGVSEIIRDKLGYAARTPHYGLLWSVWLAGVTPVF